MPRMSKLYAVPPTCLVTAPLVPVLLIVLSHLCWCFFFFFFSSRRRHTRSDRDWSSDVCSSDLSKSPHQPPQLLGRLQEAAGGGRHLLRRRALLFGGGRGLLRARRVRRGACRDLLRLPLQLRGSCAVGLGRDPHPRGDLFHQLDRRGDLGEAVRRAFRDDLDALDLRLTGGHEIGRESCRERV